MEFVKIVLFCLGAAIARGIGRRHHTIEARRILRGCLGSYGELCLGDAGRAARHWLRHSSADAQRRFLAASSEDLTRAHCRHRQLMWE